MKIKKGDTVQIQSGKDRGKSGKVLSVFPERGKLIVEGLNLYKKHQRPKRQGQKGETILTARPVPVSNVGLWCANCRRGVRAGIRKEGAGRSRFCKRCKGTV